MRVVENTFEDGYVYDGDGNDVAGFRALQNVDIVSTGVGQARTRYPATDYSGLANLPAPSGMYLVKVVFWDSGISAPQRNALLIYRSPQLPIPGVTAYSWNIYTDAPDLSASGTPNVWTPLETGRVAPVCNVQVIGAAVRIALGNKTYGGNTNDYRILTDLCALGDRSYCASQRIISRADSGNGSPVDTSRDLGSGGHIHKGWLYDHGRLYHPWAGVRRSPAFTLVNASTYAGASKLDSAEYGVLLAPVYDDDPEQIGVPQGWLFPRIGMPFDLALDITTQAGYIFSPRITGIAVYLIRRGHVSGDWEDYARIRTIPINDMPSPGQTSTIAITQSDIIATPASSWAADTDAREVPNVHYGDPIDPITGIRTTTAAGHDAMEDSISVMPMGFAFSKETMFAWGCSDDPGQTKLRLSVLDDERGQYDVFPVGDVAWKAGLNEPVNHVYEWDGRLVIAMDTNTVHLEPADPLRSRDSYMPGAESRGVGIPVPFLRTTAIGKSAMFWANHHGVWRFAAGRAQNIIEDRWQSVWDAYTDAQREAAVGGYNVKTEEYWLHVAGTIYIWSDGAVDRKNWRTYVYEGWNAIGFVTDRSTEFLMFGTIGTSQKLLRTNNRDAEFDYDDDITGTIACAIETRDRGPRDGDMVADTLTVSVDAAEAQMFLVELYGDGGATAWSSFPFYASERTPMTLDELRAAELRWRLSWTYAGGTRPAIKSMILLTADERRRAQ